MGKVNVSKLKTFTGHNDCVYTLERTQYDHIFFSGAGDGMVVYWNLEASENGQLIAKLPNSIYALHYMQSKNLLAVGHNYDGIHIIDWENRKEIGSLKLTDEAIFDIQSYHDFLIIGDKKGTITIVNAGDLRVVYKIASADYSARTIAINKTLGEMAVGYSDNKIRIYSLEDFELKYEFKAHDNSVFTVKYAPDTQFLMSAGRDAHLKIWDSKAGYLLLEDIVAHMYAINHLDFSPDGKHFVTCSMDKSIKVWDNNSFRLLKVIDKARHAGHGTSVNKLLWSKYDNLLISAGDDRAISVWDIQFNN
ncbi:WD40 repeat domain-containing protein [Fulvivirga sediminis]|uniref:WD40 repeat domain-containing protein n=1 Tax=Fulvivirga sediminis TaxID=2803949 RepID=A0A937K1D1_9BACT|nr:WD40 repeat domain-containing protein [Fulvivirga sediminis]MBL3656532.1 WD40 repeat domain-containing protein [Fulvivirga sediminis]